MTAAEQSDEVAMEQLAPQPVLSIRGTIPTAKLGETMGERIPALLGYLERSGAQATGPIFVRYHTFDNTETDIELGIPVVESVAGEGQIAAGELPGGPAFTTWHVGAHDTLGNAYARLNGWRNLQSREPDGPGWEVYCWIDPRQKGEGSGGQDPANWRTQLVQPIKPN